MNYDGDDKDMLSEVFIVYGMALRYYDGWNIEY